MIKKNEQKELTARADFENLNIDELKSFLYKNINQWGRSWGVHSLVTIQRQTMSRILYYEKLYKKIIGVPGSILEFGVQWGATLSQLISLRGMYEPYNHRRHIYGFDTFDGLLNVSEELDGEFVKNGDYSTFTGYEEELEKILTIHEKNNPISHIKKFSLIKGDILETFPIWLEENPHSIVSMAIFDLDIYEPTKKTLELVLPKLTKGSLIVFDEVNCKEFPGETRALNDIIGSSKMKLNHFPHQPNSAWAVWGD